MPSVLYRLCEALLPDYEVERELASGGMGTVFLARDVALDRRVAVKIIRPELATAHATERFLREARTLARLSHPNIVPIHRAGEARGFTYYVMDFVDGETLAERLGRGTLTLTETIRLGRDMLDALQAVHALDVVHRDVKPNNVFLVGGRAMLADFGIATASGPQTGVQQGVVTGTPGYMAPEQAFGWEIGPHTDLYAVGMVLYQALTGRRWQALLPDAPTDWSGVPHGMAAVLRRALAWNPSDRWPDAKSFRHALWRLRTRKSRRVSFLLAISGLVVGGVVMKAFWPVAGAPPADLAVLPFAVGADVPQELGEGLARLTHASIVDLDLVPFNSAARLDSAAAADPQALLQLLNARAVVRGMVQRVDRRLSVQLTVVGEDGSVLQAAPVVAEDAQMDPCRLGSEVVKLIAPAALLESFDCNAALRGRGADAVTEWLAGERAFRRQAWQVAETHFARALELDPSFALAKWRLVNARRWRRVPYDVDLAELYRDQRDQLGEMDRMLLDAWLTPLGSDRFRKYEQVLDTRKYRRDPYGWLLYGSELFHRGALVGVPLDSAAAILDSAIARDSSSGPALLQLAWASVRLGRRARAAAALRQLDALALPEAVIPPELLRLAYLERFAPDTAALALQSFLGGGQWSAATEGLGSQLRWGLFFDVAPAQADVARVLWAIPDASDRQRANARWAGGLALAAVGRFGEALGQFDSAAALARTPTASLQAAEWRVVPAAIGVAGVEAGEIERGRAVLTRLASDRTVGHRAAWALALDALARNDLPAAERWTAQVRASSGMGASHLATLLEARRLAGTGSHAQALALTDSLVPSEVGESPEAGAHGAEPFFRAAVYLLRGEWHQARGDSRFDRDWLWYQNSDLVGWPSGVPQAGEIDAVLGTHARYLRGRALLGPARRFEACGDLGRAAQLWAGGDQPLAPLLREANELLARECRP